MLTMKKVHCGYEFLLKIVLFIKFHYEKDFTEKEILTKFNSKVSNHKYFPLTNV